MGISNCSLCEESTKVNHLISEHELPRLNKLWKFPPLLKIIIQLHYLKMRKANRSYPLNKIQGKSLRCSNKYQRKMEISLIKSCNITLLFNRQIAKIAQLNLNLIQRFNRIHYWHLPHWIYWNLQNMNNSNNNTQINISLIRTNHYYSKILHMQQRWQWFNLIKKRPQLDWSHYKLTLLSNKVWTRKVIKQMLLKETKTRLVINKVSHKLKINLSILQPQGQDFILT